jgi:hypothetical protein
MHKIYKEYNARQAGVRHIWYLPGRSLGKADERLMPDIDVNRAD